MGFDGEREEYSLESKGAIRAIEIDFDLSMVIHSRGIHLEASDRIVYLFVRGLYEVCLKLPEQISDYRSVFSRKRRVLRLICDVKRLDEEVKEGESIPKKVDITIENDLLDELV